MALFYSATGQFNTADKIFKDVFKKMQNDVSYTKAMGFNMYGRMLLKHPKLNKKGLEYLQKSEKMLSVLPYWYDKIDSIYMYNFVL
jgi:hypothetical protein